MNSKSLQDNCTRSCIIISNITHMGFNYCAEFQMQDENIVQYLKRLIDNGANRRRGLH